MDSVSDVQEQLRLRKERQILVPVGLVRMEGAVFQKEPNSSVYAPRDSKARHVNRQVCFDHFLLLCLSHL